ncbi:MAG: 5'-nucleotidase [Akkermansia sp.]|nr:5'-nucleotidase [Akkermansia sp.]
MGFSTDNKLVIAVSSRALFDLEEENRIFLEKGEREYMGYQWDNRDKILEKGIAFPFVKRLLQFNSLTKNQIIEVILLSRNSPISGLRAFKSCEYYELGITRGVFTAGRDPYPYMEAFDCCLFLSADHTDVENAIKQGLPAGCVLTTSAPEDPQTRELRIAFDFDGVIADDSSEVVYQEKGLPEYQKEEREKAQIPMMAGPLQKLIEKLAKIQAWEQRLQERNREYNPRLRIAIVTARNAPAHERVVTTLRQWGITAAEAFFLGGVEKKKVLEIFRPHLFFDDQMGHLEPASQITPSVHIPFGIVNK